jgi:hypothetical protein
MFPRFRPRNGFAKLLKAVGAAFLLQTGRANAGFDF